ncbi:MAG: hypothetical protein KDD02_05415 [Phaeodactylibacter sp.]|nr:hypothetical protein [Phaeodactylibacter sp.]MCB9299843.1 hypothetical protein [Lewinellaceae bacterium]HQU59597.1 hypothetical protein [Saprospiraceae bacterium]
MTLKELFEQLAEHPAYLLFYFAIIPVMAFLAGILAKGEGHMSPWKYLYSTLIYFICVPGIFAITVSVYQFLFQRGSIMDADVFAQVLPVVSMVITLLIIRRNVNLDYIPGFDKLGGLVTVITATFIIMWFIDRTRIIVFSYLPFYQVILIFIALLLVVRYGWSKAFGSGAQAA